MQENKRVVGFGSGRVGLGWSFMLRNEKSMLVVNEMDGIFLVRFEHISLTFDGNSGSKSNFVWYQDLYHLMLSIKIKIYPPSFV